jgi:CUG-BP- and ETR3-like factor
MMHPIQDINMNARSHMEGGGYYPMSPYKNVQPPPFIGMPHGAYDHGHYSCSYHQGDAPYMHHPYHSGYGMYTPYGQGPLPPPNGPGRGQIVGQGVGPPPQVPVRPREGPTGANLFIHHLPYDLTDADLATAFNPFGNVISATVIVDRYTGESKGFGFVSYDSITSAELALEQMNGFQLGNTRIYVERKVQANHATASMKKCMTCTKELPRERFSKHQWLGKACQRRCTECINKK